jgi:signal transduction histidine kinase
MFSKTPLSFPILVGLLAFIGAEAGAQSLTNPNSTVVLTNAAQVRQLSSAAAAEGLLVRVRGVVTYFDPENELAFVQDPTAGTYVDPAWRVIESPAYSGPIMAGLMVELTGHSRPGRFAPFVSHNPAVKVLRLMDSLPEPMRPLRGLLLDPTFHSQWIELEVFVRNARIDNGRLRMGLTYGPRHFEAFVTGDWQNGIVPPELLKSDVRIRGVYGSIFNDQRQLVDMRLFVPSTNEIAVIDPGMSLAFAQAPRGIGEIMQFNPNPTERIHVQGMVLAQLPGEGLYLRGEDGAIWVGTDHEETLAPGQTVSVVGFPRPGEVRPLLLDAIVKVLEPVGEPEPVVLTAERVLGRPVDGDLVTVEARLVDLLERPGNSTLLLQSERTTFSARLLDSTPIEQALEAGSWLKLTGICVMKGDLSAGTDPSSGSLVRTEAKPTSFSLIIRNQADIALLHTPPWWTPDRVRNLLLGMAAATAGFLLWGALLRHKVNEQTVVIAERIEMERIAEERARIARELHDTLEQELVGIKMALDSAASRLDSAPEKAKHSIDQARAMIRRSQAEARQSVWDLRAANLAQENLDEALEELISPLSQPEGTQVLVETGLTVQPDFDGVIKNHVLRIAQESVTNALKHADAGRVSVRMTSTDQELDLQITDDGCGFDVASQAGKNGHFGLIGMRERAYKLNGRLSLQSEPGKGSTVRLILPMVDAKPT